MTTRRGFLAQSAATAVVASLNDPLSTAGGTASQAQPPVTASADWGRIFAVSKTIATIIACPFRPIPSASPPTSFFKNIEFSNLRDLKANYVRWHLINASRHVAEIYPPTTQGTSWDFSRLDADIVPFLEATKGYEPIINFTLVPFWMFKTGRPIPLDNNLDDPNILRDKYGQAFASGLVDPTGEQIGDYFARVVSWYTQGGFTDENEIYHHSGYHYHLPWLGVLNEVDTLDLAPAQYTLLYDSIVSAAHKVSPRTKFVGLSLGLPSLQPEFFEYFLNPKNHRSGIPLDMVAYHFYAGAVGLGGCSENETIADWQYTFFNQAAGFLSTVRYIDSIRKRLSPTTRVNLDELGALLTDDIVSAQHPEKAKPIPSLYWNLHGALFAYLYVELARLGIDVATLSGIYDRPSGGPGYRPSSITLMDPASGKFRASIRVLQLIKDNFGPGDKLVFTRDRPDPFENLFSDLSSADVSLQAFVTSMEKLFSELASADIALQAFVTSKGKRLLIVNKRLRAVDIDLGEMGSVASIQVVDEHSGDAPARKVETNGQFIRLGSFAVAVVEFR